MAEGVSGVLSGSNIVSFSDDLSEQVINDILDCVCYSEIVASEKSDRQKAWFGWINRYQGGLLKSGLKINGVLDDRTVSIEHHRELPYVAFRLIQDYGHQELGKLARASLDALLRGDHAQSFFKDWFSNSVSESFQLVPCRQAASGDVEVMVCGLQLVTESTQGGWFQRPDARMTIHVDGGAFLYKPETFAPHRAKLNERLQKYSGEYFDSLRARRPIML